MSKRKPLGQDPLAWIKKTGEGEGEAAERAPDAAEDTSRGSGQARSPTAEDQDMGAEPTEEAPAAAAAPGGESQAPQRRIRWPFLLIVTLDFLLLIILGVLGYMLLSSRMDRLSARVTKLEAARPGVGRTSAPAPRPSGGPP